MKIKIIDFGYQNAPLRAHYNDAGADVYSRKTCVVGPQETVALGLGFGLEVPDGFMGLVFPRSGLSKRGICCQLPPIDSGYRGEVHAIVTNYSNCSYEIKEGDRVGQLVIVPIVVADFITDDLEQRGKGAFGSTGSR